MSDDKRCGTCRFFGPGVGANLCVMIFPDLPFWAVESLEYKAGDVKPDDGKDCDTWSAKPT